MCGDTGSSTHNERVERLCREVNISLSACTANVSAMSSERVSIPRIVFQPCSSLSAQLSTINTSLTCNDNGWQLYTQCTHVVGQHLISGCNNCSS